MPRSLSFNSLFFGTVLGLLLLIPATASGQERVKIPKRIQAPSISQICTQIEQLKEKTRKLPVLVLPERKGFKSLQGAIDFCTKKKRTGKSSGKGIIVLQPGTYTGNFSLPNDMSIVGIAGFPATTIQGAPGVNQPALTFTPSGGGCSECAVFGLTIIGREVAAVAYSGATVESEFFFHGCDICVEDGASIPAVVAVGAGIAPNRQKCLEFTDCEIISEAATGTTIDIDVGPYFMLSFENSWIVAGDVAVDIDCTSNDTTWMSVFKTRVEAGQYGIKARNLDHLYVLRSEIRGEQNAIEMTATEATIHYCELRGANGYGVQVLTDPVTQIGSNASIGFCGFFTPLLVFVDAGSLSEMVFNHHHFLKL